MLAYYVEWHMRQALAPLRSHDEALPATVIYRYRLFGVGLKVRVLIRKTSVESQERGTKGLS